MSAYETFLGVNFKLQKKSTPVCMTNLNMDMYAEGF